MPPATTPPLAPPAAAAARRPWALRERVGLGLGAVMVACSVALALTLAASARSALVDAAARNVDTLARQMARELSFGMERFVREIELQARSPVFADPAAPPGQLRAALEAIQQAYPEFSHISVVDVASARVIAATGGIFEGGDASGRPVFVEGQKRLFVADVHDAVRLAALLPRPASGEPLRFLDAAAPIRAPDGRAVRVLGSHLSWEWASALKTRVLEPVEQSRQVQILLVDTGGKVVLPPDASVPVGAQFVDVASTAPARPASRWSDGTEYLSAQAPTFASGSFPGLGWRVVVRQPMAVVLAESERLRNLFLAGGLLLGLLAAAIGWFVTGRLVRPVTDLARDAAGLAPGSHVAWPPTPASVPQVAEVAAVREAFERVTGEALARAERLLGELHALYEGAPVGLCVVDERLRYRRANRVWLEAFGDAEQPDSARLPPALVAAIHGAAAGGERPFGLEVETQTARGLRAWQTVVAPLRENGEAVGASIVATDVTDIRRAERELRAADRRKNEFVSMLAHELRNPLAPIVSALEVLDRHPGEEQGQRMRSMMRRQLRRMVRLIDDLLDVARVTHGKVTLQVAGVPVREVCQAAVDSIAHLAQARNQRVEVAVEEELPPLRGDRVRLEQIVSNLLANASKYGGEGGAIRLAAAFEAPMLRIVVEDDGRGIAPEFLPHVFDLFAQGDQGLARTDGGLGIGLTLVRTLVEMHGGEVEAHSDGPGRGARFTVWLPAQPPAEELAVLALQEAGTATTRP